MNRQVDTNRYSEEDLQFFQSLIQEKLDKSNKDYSFMRDQLNDMAEAKDNEGDWMDDTSSNIDMEMLSTMANRLRKHIQDLDFAMIRIKNKSYGICVVTGELIDKRRLIAVPATTKSVVGKQPLKKGLDVVERKRMTPAKSKSDTPKIITKVIRKKKLNEEAAAAKSTDYLFDENDDDDYIGTDLINSFDMNDLSDKDNQIDQDDLDQDDDDI